MSGEEKEVRAILRTLQLSVEENTVPTNITHVRPMRGELVTFYSGGFKIIGPLPKKSQKKWKARSEWSCVSFGEKKTKSYFIYKLETQPEGNCTEQTIFEKPCVS